MTEKTFVTEIDKISGAHFGYEEPAHGRAHAKKTEARIRAGETPKEIRYAFFKLTNRCNSDCAYCEHAYSRNQGKNADRPLEEILPVVEQLAQMGVRACSVSGGEPLTYQGIEEVVRAFTAHKIEPILLTNGVLLPQKLEGLYAAGLRYIIMSIDSFDPAHYKSNRGIELAPMLKGYEYVLAFQKTHPDLRLDITTVVSKHNVRDILPLLEKAEKDGVGVQLTPYHNFINREETLAAEDGEEMSRLVQTLLKKKEAGAPVYSSREYLSFFPEFLKGKSRIPKQYVCKCGFEAVYIWHDLTVRSCWSTSLPPVGNLREHTLREIWESEGYRAQRQKMLACQCEGCWLLCTAEFNIAHEKYRKESVE